MIKLLIYGLFAVAFMVMAAGIAEWVLDREYRNDRERILNELIKEFGHKEGEEDEN